MLEHQEKAVGADSGYLRLNEVQALLRISRTTLWRLRQQGVLPAPIRVSPRVQVFDRRKIDEYLGGKAL
jgi:predicted DNA-binding transcriptional regulator AlpA